MRAPTETRDQKTARYLATVAELEHYADLHRFEGAGSFYAWERFNMLVNRLREHFDHYELEGDAAPVRQEIERYHSDLWRLHVKPDAWVVGRLNEFLGWLEEDACPEVQILTSVIPAAPVGVLPKGMLAVNPEELKRLLEKRTNPPGA